MPSMPMGPKALSLRSRTVSLAWALRIPALRFLSAGGISVFMRPVNMSFQCASSNSECFSRACPMAPAASMPTVLPEKVSFFMFLKFAMSATTGSASFFSLSLSPLPSKLRCPSSPVGTATLPEAEESPLGTAKENPPPAAPAAGLSPPKENPPKPPALGASDPAGMPNLNPPPAPKVTAGLAAASLASFFCLASSSCPGWGVSQEGHSISTSSFLSMQPPHSQEPALGLNLSKSEAVGAAWPADEAPTCTAGTATGEAVAAGGGLLEGGVFAREEKAGEGMLERRAVVTMGTAGPSCSLKGEGIGAVLGRLIW